MIRRDFLILAIASPALSFTQAAFSTPNVSWFQGSISHFRIYDLVLSEEEIGVARKEGGKGAGQDPRKRHSPIPKTMSRRPWNLTSHQGVTTRHCWGLGLFLALGVVGVQKRAGK